jgi:hypothetical protein
MNALALVAAAAAWSAPQTVSAPHTFAGPLYASADATGGALAAWGWQDGVGQKAPTGSGLARAGDVVAPEQAGLDGLTGAVAYGDGGAVQLASKQVDTRGRRWRLTVRDGSTSTHLATGFILFRPQLAVAPDGSAIAAWVELHGRRQIVRAATRAGTGRFSKPFTVSGHGRTTVVAAAAGEHRRYLVAFVRDGRLLARTHARRWSGERTLSRARGKTHWQLTAAMAAGGNAELVWIRHRFTSPGRPGVRELFAAGLAGRRWSSVQRVERDSAVGPSLLVGPGPFALAYAFGPNSGAVARVRFADVHGHFGPAIDAAPRQGGLRSVSVAPSDGGGIVAGWVIPNPSGDGGGIGYAASTGTGGAEFGPREQVTPNEATFDMRLVRTAAGVRAFWTARPDGTGPSVPVAQVRTVVRSAIRLPPAP